MDDKKADKRWTVYSQNYARMYHTCFVYIFVDLCCNLVGPMCDTGVFFYERIGNTILTENKDGSSKLGFL